MPLIKKHQTLLDFATQRTGKAEGLFDVAVLNGLSITEEPVPGAALKVPEITEGKQLQVINFFIESGLDIMSFVKNVATEEVLSGVDYWAIEEDFIVQ